MRLTQMYNGICSAWVNVEHILFLSVSNRGLGPVVCIVGIGFALLAHPWLGILRKKSQPPSVFVPAFRFIPYWQANFPLGIKRKSGATFVVPDFLRRERDSCFGKRLRRLRTPTRAFSSPLIQKKEA